MDFRTDLALERRELFTDAEIPGVKSRTSQTGNAHVTAIEVQTEQGVQAIGKPVGKYVTVEVPPFSADAELLDGRLTAVADELRALLPEEGLVLVAGIGNDHITPDALGPLSGERILATRHIGPELAKSIGMDAIPVPITVSALPSSLVISVGTSFFVLISAVLSLAIKAENIVDNSIAFSSIALSSTVTSSVIS